MLLLDIITLLLFLLLVFLLFMARNRIRKLEQQKQQKITTTDQAAMIGMHQDITRTVILRRIQKAMNIIINDIIAHEKLDQILCRICTATHETEPSIHCVIYLSSDNNKQFNLHHSSDIPESLLHILKSITVEDKNSELFQTVNQKEVLFIEQLHKLQCWQSANQILNTLNLTTYYGQPLLNNKKEPQGAICLYLQDKNIPEEIIREIMDITSGVASVAIEGQLQADNQNSIQLQLYHSQKMDSLGHLTGGIAHDFNNILGSIVGYNSLAKKIAAKQDNDKLTTFLNEVSTAAERARDLINQMMVFSRSEPSKNISIMIKPVVKEVLQLVKSMIPSSITINYHFAKDIPNIMINPIALHQVIMNLLINAKDAINNEVGLITVSIYQSAKLSENCLSCHNNFEGQFVCIEITDTGSGIATELQDQIFEPFFTTKDIGRGTGMGLSVVHGIIHDVDGHIQVSSKPDKGTNIQLYFPALEDDKIAASGDIYVNNNTSSVGNGEHIMVVDDDESLSLLYEEILQNYGYQVSRFDNSQLALEVFLKDPEKFKLILSDQTMPFLTGDEMAIQMLSINPELPIIICTGYSEKLNEKDAKTIGIKSLLQKPIDMHKLLDLINEIIQEDKGSK